MSGHGSGKEEEVAERASGGSTFSVRGGGLFIYHLFTYWACINIDEMEPEERVKWEEMRARGKNKSGEGWRLKTMRPRAPGEALAADKKKTPSISFYF